MCGFLKLIVNSYSFQQSYLANSLLTYNYAGFLSKHDCVIPLPNNYDEFVIFFFGYHGYGPVKITVAGDKKK